MNKTLYDASGRVMFTGQGTFLDNYGSQNGGLNNGVFDADGHTDSNTGCSVITVNDPRISGTDDWPTTTSTYYNPLGQVIESTDQYNGHTFTLYDINGRVVATVYPDGTETRSVYDDAGRVIWASERFASQTSIILTPVGGDVYTVNVNTGYSEFDNDENYVVTHTTYDALGQVTDTQRYSGAQIDLDVRHGPHERDRPRDFRQLHRGHEQRRQSRWDAAFLHVHDL